MLFLTYNTYFIKMNLKLFIPILLFLLFCSSVKSQSSKKDHFSLITNKSASETIIYETAVRDYADIDKFRFYDKRRRIIIQNSEITLELHSALELKEKYGKPIAPLTIMPGSEYQGVEFYLTDGEKRSLVPLFQKNQFFKY